MSKTVAICLGVVLGFVSGLPAAGAGEPPAASSSPATYGAWHSCQIGGGGCVLGVVPCPGDTNRYYSFVDIGSCYRSDNGGRRWRMLHGALPPVEGNYMTRDLSVDPRDADRLIIAVGSAYSKQRGQLFLSRDGGATFTPVLQTTIIGAGKDSAAGHVLVRQPGTPDTLLFGSVLDGVWKSTDNGATWTNRGMKGVNAVAIVHDLTDARHVWLCAQEGKRRVLGEEQNVGGGFYESRDGGETWTQVAAKAPTELVQPPFDKQTLYGIWDGRPAVSKDNGKTWTPFDTDLPAKTKNWMVGNFGALVAGPDFLLAGMLTGDIYRLAPGETAWKKVERASMTATYEGRDWYKRSEIGKYLNSITIDPANPAHWFFTDWYAIYQTRDGGKNWRLTIDGMEITAIHCFEQDPSDPKMVHLGMADNGYFRSVDGGTTFTQVNSQNGISNNIKCISLSAKNPSRVYAVGPREWHWEANQLFISDNKGQRWRRSKMQGLPSMKDHHCNTVAVSPADPNSVFLCVSGKIGEGGGVYHSTDGGDTWQAENDGLPQKEPFFQWDIWHFGRELVVDDRNNLVCYSARQNKLFFRPAGGKWQAAAPLPANAKINGLAVSSGAPGFVLAACQYGGLWRSADGGKQWTRILDKNVYHAAVDRGNSRRLLASVPGEGVYASYNGGADWEPLDTRLPYRLLFSYVGFAGNRALVGTDGSGAFWMELKK